jgi:hypothetical protein
VSSGNPESSTFYNSYRINNGVTTPLQHWYIRVVKDLQH